MLVMPQSPAMCEITTFLIIIIGTTQGGVKLVRGNPLAYAIFGDNSCFLDLRPVMEGLSAFDCLSMDLPAPATPFLWRTGARTTAGLRGQGHTDAKGRPPCCFHALLRGMQCWLSCTAAWTEAK